MFRISRNGQHGFSGLAGFTLAEVLIALLILGEIATFTIPKVINSQQRNSYNAIAKEAAGTISDAFQKYRNSSGASAYATTTDLTQYFNYIKMDTSSLIDDLTTSSSITCSASDPCFRLANGAIIHHWGDRLCVSSNTAIPFEVDPDGNYSGTTNGAGKSIRFWIYSNGRLTTEGALSTNTQWAGGGTTTCDHSRSATPANDPTWFSW
jgi:type II secretory pathway pseudopilin PulG